MRFVVSWKMCSGTLAIAYCVYYAVTFKTQNRRNAALKERNFDSDIFGKDGEVINGGMMRTGLEMLRIVSTRGRNETRHKLKPSCPSYPDRLIGRLKIKRRDTNPADWGQIFAENPALSRGGIYRPEDCEARYKVALIIPLRGREAQLRQFLSHMHPIWQRQQIEYRVYVITQVADGQLFNKAKLMNAGFAEIVKDDHFDCFVFHDVDMLLENDRCLYWCNEKQPRHLAKYVDKFSYKPKQDAIRCPPKGYSHAMDYFGGAITVTKKQFLDANGFSNYYHGWGNEDDDIHYRFLAKGYKVEHKYGRKCSYHMIKHPRESLNKENLGRHVLTSYAISRMDREGLNSLRYYLHSVAAHFTFTNITVDLGRPSKKMQEFLDFDFSSLKEICKSPVPWLS